MKKRFFLYVAIVFFPVFTLAQEDIQIIDNTLNTQMDEVFEKSNSYKEYKVIKKSELATLRSNILDSISELKQNITNQQDIIQNQQAAIDTLNLQLKQTEENLAISQENEKSIWFLGIQMTKSSYNALLFSIIGILVLACAFLGYRFVTSYKVIRNAELKIAEMEIEIEDYRRNSLEREQKLRRKLQDEINKNRKLQ